LSGLLLLAYLGLPAALGPGVDNRSRREVRWGALIAGLGSLAFVLDVGTESVGGFFPFDLESHNIVALRLPEIALGAMGLAGALVLFRRIRWIGVEALLLVPWFVFGGSARYEGTAGWHGCELAVAALMAICLVLAWRHDLRSPPGNDAVSTAS